MSDLLQFAREILSLLPMTYGTYLIPVCLMALSKWLLGKRMGFDRDRRRKLCWFPILWPCAYVLLPSVWVANGLLLLLEYLLCIRVLPERRTAYFCTSTLLCALILLIYGAVLLLVLFLLMPFYF